MTRYHFCTLHLLHHPTVTLSKHLLHVLEDSLRPPGCGIDEPTEKGCLAIVKDMSVLAASAVASGGDEGEESSGERT